MWDTYGQAVGITRPLAKPGSKWFMIAADYAFGQQIVADATGLVQKAGGEVIGSVRHPFNFAGDFSPFLVQAQSLRRRRHRPREHRHRPHQHPQGPPRNSAAAAATRSSPASS